LLIVPSEDLGEDAAGTHARVLSFLGAAPHRLDSYPRVYERQYEPMQPATRERLAAEFEEPDRRLYQLLRRDLRWRERGPADTGAGRRARQTPASSRYGKEPPAPSPSQPPRTGPTTLPAAHAPFIAPKTSAAEMPRRSAASVSSAMPGV